MNRYIKNKINHYVYQLTWDRCFISDMGMLHKPHGKWLGEIVTYYGLWRRDFFWKAIWENCTTNEASSIDGSDKSPTEFLGSQL
jgi:hypothetical protein